MTDTVTITRELYVKLVQDQAAMRSIQEALSGVEWNSETLDQVAGIVIQAGYTIRDIDGVEQV